MVVFLLLANLSFLVVIIFGYHFWFLRSKLGKYC